MKQLTPVKAIRLKCVDCCAGQLNEVKLCTVEDCPLFPYRMGKRPKKPHFYTQRIRKKAIPKETSNE